MSTRVAVPVSTARLRQLAKAVSKADWSEFSMRVPAEPDRDADIVLIDAADEIDRLRAATQANGWQPMDTAPLDGREVLLQVKVRAGIPGKCLVGHYMPGGHCIEDHPPIDAGWHFWDGCMFDKAAAPVAWMALPPADAAQQPGSKS